MIPAPLYALFQLIQFGLVVHVLCTIALRFYVRIRNPVFPALFAEPVLNKGVGSYLLRLKYFLPWVPAPAQLAQEKSLVRILFWGARLGGTILALGLVIMVGIMFYVGLGKSA